MKKMTFLVGSSVAAVAVFLAVFLFVFVTTDRKGVSTGVSSDETAAYGAAGAPQVGASSGAIPTSKKAPPPSAVRSTRSS